MFQTLFVGVVGLVLFQITSINFICYIYCYIAKKLTISFQSTLENLNINQLFDGSNKPSSPYE